MRLQRDRVTKKDIIAKLQQLNRRDEGREARPVNGWRPDKSGLANMKIGLHYGLLQHVNGVIEGDKEHDWTESEELRFQFSITATLCHELAHMFWLWTQGACWSCESNEPRVSKIHGLDEKTEVGNAWEYWAFGRRVPQPMHVIPVASRAQNVQRSLAEQPLHLFTRSNWHWTNATVESGKPKHTCIFHSFVSPVKWFGDWFREETWNRINTYGRQAGRPSSDEIKILQEIGVRLTDETEDERLDRFAVELYRLTYTQLVEKGGFAIGAYRTVYGPAATYILKPLLNTKALTEHYITRLRERQARKQCNMRRLIPSRRSR
jgi:hypothetical protein